MKNFLNRLHLAWWRWRARRSMDAFDRLLKELDRRLSEEGR